MQDVKVYWRKFWFAVIILQKQYVINTILTHSIASDFPISLTLFFPLIIKNHLITNLEKPANKGQSLESRYNDQQGLTRERQHQQTTKSLRSNYWCYNNKILNTVFHPHIFKIKGSAMKFHKSLKNQTKKKKGGWGGGQNSGREIRVSFDSYLQKNQNDFRTSNFSFFCIL